MKRAGFLLLAFVVLLVPVSSEQAISNQDVINMVASGLSDDVIVAAIRQASARSFDLSPSGLIALKRAKVSDKLILVMQSPQSDAAAPIKPTDKSPQVAAEVKVKLATALSSQKAHLGDRVDFELASDLTIDGRVVAEKGARAWGQITEAIPQRLTRPGRLDFSIDHITGTDGDVTVHATPFSETAGRGRVTADELEIAPGTEFIAKITEVTASGPAAGDYKVPEIGVYYRDRNKWADLLPEVVNWKTGGVLKHVASAGIIKGDLNGSINRPTSRIALRPRTELLVYTTDGVAITEYQLLRLHPQSESREFRTITGGVMHAEGGAMRDLLQFESTKVAPRTYILALPNLGAGEYGVLSPGMAAASSASAQLGKIYTFRIENGLR